MSKIEKHQEKRTRFAYQRGPRGKDEPKPIGDDSTLTIRVGDQTTVVEGDDDMIARFLKKILSGERGEQS